MKNKIAIFTTFNSYDPVYSLMRVAENQIKQLIKNDYQVVTIASEGFPGGGWFNQTEIRYLPTVPISNDGITPTFENDVDTILVKLPELLKDIKIAFTHDIFFQNASLPYNEAVRRYLEQDKDVFLLNWIHSVPSEKPELIKYPLDIRFKRVPNSYMIYPNDWDKIRLSKSYDIEMDEIKVIHHPIDIDEFMKLEPDTIEFVEKYNIYDADVIAVYPLRMDRGKQPEKMIKIMSALKNRNLDVRCIIVDFHSTGGDKVTFKDECKEWARITGLNDDLIWTSEFKDKFKISCPYQFVGDLTRLANIFIMPSRSETFSLVTAEAALSKNLLILNQDFPPMRDIYGSAPIYFQFGSNVNVLSCGFGSVESDFNSSYVQSIAASIQYYLKNDRALNTSIRVRKMYNLNRVFKDELEPLMASICDISTLKKDPNQKSSYPVDRAEKNLNKLIDGCIEDPVRTVRTETYLKEFNNELLEEPKELEPNILEPILP